MLNTYSCSVVKGLWDHLLKIPFTADSNLLGPFGDGKDVAGM